MIILNYNAYFPLFRNIIFFDDYHIMSINSNLIAYLMKIDYIKKYKMNQKFNFQNKHLRPNYKVDALLKNVPNVN